jgi:hypothetical protein
MTIVMVLAGSSGLSWRDFIETSNPNAVTGAIAAVLIAGLSVSGMAKKLVHNQGLGVKTAIAIALEFAMFLVVAYLLWLYICLYALEISYMKQVLHVFLASLLLIAGWRLYRTLRKRSKK